MYLDSYSNTLIAIEKKDLEKFQKFALENSLNIQTVTGEDSADNIRGLAAELQAEYQESWEDSSC